MTTNPTLHHRRSIRLRAYDYSSVGAYFVTICTHNWACLFGEVVDGEMLATAAGQVVGATWENLPSHYPGVALDVFVIMPNHIHGIIVIDGIPNLSGVGAQFIAPPRHPPSPQTRIIRPGDGDKGAMNRAPTPDLAPTLGDIIRGFKARTTRILRRDHGMVRVWLRNYYEHVVRDDVSLSRVREYIANNPTRWAFDRENPVHHVATNR